MISLWGENVLEKEFYFKSSRKGFYIKSENNDVSFYKNEEKLNFDVADTSSGESFLEFKKIIQLEVSNIFNTKFDNIILLAGAGASVVISNNKIDKNYGKTVKMISEIAYNYFKNNSSSKIYTFEELANKMHYPTKVISADGIVLSEDFNLEDFLSKLISYSQFVIRGKNKYNNSINELLKIIKENTDYDYNSDVFKHGALLNILSRKVKSTSKLSIVTTNYDTLFEEAAESLNYTIFDGFTFQYNPRFSSDIFDWNIVKNIPNVKTNELVYYKKVFNLIKIHGSINWKRAKNGYIYRKGKKEFINLEESVMIFPSADKYAQTYQEPYFELFTKFQELVRKPNSLLITTGFSFSDNHITKIITQAITDNNSLTVLISDFNISQQSENWKKLERLMNEHYPVYFLKATLNGDLTEYLGGKYEN